MNIKFALYNCLFITFWVFARTGSFCEHVHLKYCGKHKSFLEYQKGHERDANFHLFGPIQGCKKLFVLHMFTIWKVNIKEENEHCLLICIAILRKAHPLLKFQQSVSLEYIFIDITWMGITVLIFQVFVEPDSWIPASGVCLAEISRMRRRLWCLFDGHPSCTVSKMSI